MEVPIESADDLADQTNIEYGTIHAGSTMTFFQVRSRPWGRLCEGQEHGRARCIHESYCPTPNPTRPNSTWLNLVQSNPTWLNPAQLSPTQPNPFKKAQPQLAQPNPTQSGSIQHGSTG